MCSCTTKRSCTCLCLLCLCECSELPGEGYAVLKGISSVDQMTTEQPVVDELNLYQARIRLSWLPINLLPFKMNTRLWKMMMFAYSCRCATVLPLLGLVRIDGKNLQLRVVFLGSMLPQYMFCPLRMLHICVSKICYRPFRSKVGG